MWPLLVSALPLSVATRGFLVTRADRHGTTPRYSPSLQLFPFQGGSMICLLSNSSWTLPTHCPDFPWTCSCLFHPHHLLPRRRTEHLTAGTPVGSVVQGATCLGAHPALSGWGPASPARSGPHSVRNWSWIHCWLPRDLPVILANSVTLFGKEQANTVRLLPFSC